MKMAQAGEENQIEWDLAQDPEPMLEDPVDIYQALGVPRPNVAIYRSPNFE